MTPRARVLTVALAVFFVICAGAVFLAVRNMLEDTSFSVLRKTACELLTPEKAKTLLGETAKKSTDEAEKQETADLKITQCAYATQGTSIQDTRIVTLEVRAAKTEVGAAENASRFLPNRADGRQVPGYGDDALWDPLAGHLSIIKDGNFYLVDMSKGLGIGAVKLNEVQAVADIIGLKD